MPDQPDEPADWERPSRAHRILREASANRLADDIPDEPEEAAGEIISSPLKHEIAEELGPAGGNLIKTVAEARGIRTSIVRQYRDPLEDAVQKHIFAWTAADMHELLFFAANRHLKAKDRMDFFAVVETAERIADAEGKDPNETTTRHFQLWLNQTRSETGVLSIETAAAAFLQASDQLYMLLDGNREMQAAARNYANAWHWLHMELMGEHELAAKGADAERGRKAGPKAKRDQGALLSAIIALAYKKFAANEPNEANRTSTKFVAPKILNSVNEMWMLQTKKKKPIKVGTIKNRLPEIINGAKTKRPKRARTGQSV